jgi:hypothetical protein
MKKVALIIFVKIPMKGRVKTRLSPHLSDEKILELYKSFVIKITSTCSLLKGVKRFLGCMPTKDDDFIMALAERYGYECFEQRGQDLGQRIINAFRDYFKKGYERVVIIGSDSPTLPLEYIRQSFRILGEKDFVLGPCNDGGYYLVGARKLYEHVFRRIPWDTPEVLNRTLDRLDSRGIDYFLLPFWYDVDTIDDLRFYKRHLKYLKRMERC